MANVCLKFLNHKKDTPRVMYTEEEGEEQGGETAHKSSLQNRGKGGVKEHLTICVHNSQTVACILLCFLYFTLLKFTIVGLEPW